MTILFVVLVQSKVDEISVVKISFLPYLLTERLLNAEGPGLHWDVTHRS